VLGDECGEKVMRGVAVLYICHVWPFLLAVSLCGCKEKCALVPCGRFELGNGRKHDGCVRISRMEKGIRAACKEGNTIGLI